MENNMNTRRMNNSTKPNNGMPQQSCAVSGSACGSCDELMKAIMEADFFAQDLKLYLDTHPKDSRAIEMYRDAVRQCKACKAAFEDNFYPLTADCAGETGGWNWLDGNFPPLS